MTEQETLTRRLLALHMTLKRLCRVDGTPTPELDAAFALPTVTDSPTWEGTVAEAIRLWGDGLVGYRMVTIKHGFAYRIERVIWNPSRIEVSDLKDTDGKVYGAYNGEERIRLLPEPAGARP